MKTIIQFAVAIIVLIASPLRITEAATLTNSNINTRAQGAVVTFDDLTFANATSNISNLIQLIGAIGDSGTFGGFGRQLSTGFVFTPGSGIQLSNISISPASKSFTATIIGLQGDSVNWSNYQPPATPSQGFSYSNIVLDPTSGYYQLQFNIGGNGLLKAGGIFTMDLSLPGDWSQQGTGIGQTQFESINSAFSITQDFVYDSGSNTTIFQAIDSNYDGSSGVNLQFILHGSAVAPVPEPETYAMMLAGLGLLGFVGGRKSKQATV